jgi:hypothetical protein
LIFASIFSAPRVEECFALPSPNPILLSTDEGVNTAKPPPLSTTAQSQRTFAEPAAADGFRLVALPLEGILLIIFLKRKARIDGNNACTSRLAFPDQTFLPQRGCADAGGDLTGFQWTTPTILALASAGP